MKFLIAVIMLSATLFGCSNNQFQQAIKENTIDSLLSIYNRRSGQLPNELQQVEYKKKFLDTINSVLKDSLNFDMGNILVTSDVMAINKNFGVTAFIATFSDRHHNEYNFELDYPLTDDTSVTKNSNYNFLKNIPSHADTMLHFFYLGSVDWKDNTNTLSITAVPFGPNFNLDSARKVNLMRKKK